MIYNKIKNLLNKKGLTIDKMADEADITPAGFHYMVQNDTLKVKTLQKISDYLGVPITYWFEESEDKMLMAKEKGVSYGEIVIKKEEYEF